MGDFKILILGLLGSSSGGWGGRGNLSGGNHFLRGGGDFGDGMKKLYQLQARRIGQNFVNIEFFARTENRKSS